MVRVSAQLIDTETGAQVWSDRVDGNWTASMEVQDVITSQLARRLDLELTEQESRRAEDLRASSPDAVDLAMRGWSVLNKPYSRDQLAQSRDLFERAWQSIPIAKGSRRIGKRSCNRGQLSMEHGAQGSAEACGRLHRSGVDLLSPTTQWRILSRAKIQRARGRNIEVAVREYETAISLNASLAPAYGALGGAKIRFGRSKEAFDPLQMAIRLSSPGSTANIWYFYICHAHSHLGEYEEAIEWSAGPSR